jgi:preprotein translocase subunit SecA
VRTAEQAEQSEQKQGQAPQQTSTSGNGTTSTGRSDMRTNRDDGGPTTNTGKKLGRNDPCWCGSGKKFKKCHGR